jgi:Zn-dependent M28 family amino/carboxypeptidase
MSHARGGLGALTEMARGIKMIGYPANAVRFAALFEK